MNTSNHGRRVTGHDVARAAGVSQATVSLVMTGKTAGRISNDQRDRVLQIARDLGYQPNASARSLRLGRAQVVALVVPNVANPFFSSVLLGAERAARARGNAVMLLDMGTDVTWHRWMGDLMSARAVDGCIVYAANPIAADDVRRLGTSVVLVEARSPGAASVELDIAGGIAAAMAHLLDLGHRRIGHLAADYGFETFRLRAEAYAAALGRAGVNVTPDLVESSPFGIDASTMAAGILLDRQPGPSAILCDDDLLAAGVYKAASDRQLTIPRDLSVVGVDDIELARMLEPALTTVAIPAEAIGEVAVDLLLGLIERGRRKAVTLPLELLVRGSTGVPGPRP
jgi:DNA-binding LacI/PurR family transcriptional regulator